MSCAVKYCKNRSAGKNKNAGITFHRFPKKNESWRNDWIQIVRNCNGEIGWIPNQYSVICSEHFEVNDINTTKGGSQRVVTCAVPKKFLFESTHLVKDQPGALLSVSSASQESMSVIVPSLEKPRFSMDLQQEKQPAVPNISSDLHESISMTGAKSLEKSDTPTLILKPNISSTIRKVNLVGDDSSSCVEPSNKRRKLDDDDSECDENDSDIEDEHDFWAKECALELRQMDPEQQIFAKRAIKCILMEGQSGLLHKNSVQINNKIIFKDNTREELNDPSLDEFLVIRKGDTESSSVVACHEVVAPSGSALSLVNTGVRSISACHKSTVRSSVMKSNSSAITVPRKFGSSSLDNAGSHFVEASSKAVGTVGSSLSLVKTEPCDYLQTSSVKVYQKIVTSDVSSSTLMKLEPFDETEQTSQEIPAVGPTMLHVKSEPWLVEKSSPFVKTEPNSPPSSPGFTVMIKEEPE